MAEKMVMVGVLPEAVVIDSGEQVVWMLKDATPHRVRFKPGISDGTYTEVMSGDLREGDVVITDVLGGAAAANAFRAF